MMYIAIALTLLALIGGILLLSKVKTDAMGSFAKWMAYLVIVVSLGMLLCELGRSALRIMHCRGDGMGEHHGMMYCPPEMCGGHACYMPAMMGKGKMHGAMHCCKEDMEDGKGMGCHDMEDHDHESMQADSSVKK